MHVVNSLSATLFSVPKQVKFLTGLVAKSGPSPPLQTDSRYRSTLAADATKLHQLKRRK